MDMVYEVDNEIKQEYLSSKPTATAESDSFILRTIDEYEQLVNKPVYNLTISELDELFSKFGNTSKSSGDKNKSILVTYIDFCINKNLVLHKENRARFIDIKKHVSKQALLNKFISKEKLKDYQKLLYNEQDQLLLELLFLGVRGRTVGDETLEEIINLSIDDVDFDNNIIKLRKNNNDDIRTIKVETSTVGLIKDTFEQEIYVENNGEITNNPRIADPRKSKINRFENLIFRIPGKNKFEKFHSALFNSRMTRIKKWVDNPYLTATTVYESGMIQMAMDIYREKGEVTKDDYIDICDRFDYGYPFKLKEKFVQYEELLLK